MNDIKRNAQLLEAMAECGVSAAHDPGGVDPRALAWVAGFVDTPNSKLAIREALGYGDWYEGYLHRCA